MTSEYYKGTDLKVQISISAEGFDQEDNNYDIDVYCGEEVKHYNQDNVVSDGEGHYLLPLPTEELSAGKITLVITAYVPDADFADYGGIRKEVSAPIKIGVLKEII